MKLHYLGPKGTFSFLASQQIVSEPSIDRCAQSNLLEVILAVVNNKEDMGIVPIENSIEGTINMVADALAQQDIFAHGEIIINIHFGLYALPHTSLSDISTVYSIAPAISQTRNFIHQHGFNYDYVDSTIQSLDKITSTTAAIAPLGSGERLGFKALASNIEDYPHNTTRFLIIKNHNHFKPYTSQTILVITPQSDKPGLLASILNTFALFNINLSWIESRPLKTELGKYRFFVQADRGLNDELKKVISILETLDFKIKFIGSFSN